MTTVINNERGTKKVVIKERNDLGYTSIFAQYIQIVNNGNGTTCEQVLHSKSFSTMNGAKKWAANCLN